MLALVFNTSILKYLTDFRAVRGKTIFACYDLKLREDDSLPVYRYFSYSKFLVELV